MSDLPPAIGILLDEPPPESSDFASERSYLKKLLPELRRQAIWSRDNYRYAGADGPLPVGRFAFCSAGSTDPFGSACCFQRECRLGRAVSFARTVALFSDVSFVMDSLTGRLLATPRVPQTEMLANLMTDVRVLYLLRPLIESGAVSFRAPYSRFCDKCYTEMKRRAAELSGHLRGALGASIECELTGGFITIKGHQLFDPPLTLLYKMTPKQKEELKKGSTVKAIASSHVERSLLEEVDNLLIAANASQRLGAAIIGSSRFELLVLKELEGSRLSLDSLEKWEAPRSVRLPWISSLSVAEVVRLRDEAGASLVGLRERLSAALLYGDSDSIGSIMAGLRQEAAAVEAELQALQRRRSKTFRNVAGVLGVGFSVYGFASGLVPAGHSLATLSSLLALMHSSSHREEQDSIRLTARPGYALLHAREILEHRKG